MKTFTGRAIKDSPIKDASLPPQPGLARQPLAVRLAGLAAMLLLGALAFWLSSLHPSLDALVLALILGIALKLFLPTAAASMLLAGAQTAIRLFIPLAIILYGINLDLTRLVTLPVQAIITTLLGMILFYGVIFWLNRLLWKIPPRLNELIATGSAICGASAIAILSPSIEAEPEDVSGSILSITAVGLLALMVYPILQAVLGLSENQYALLSGATLHQTGLVRAAVADLSESARAYALAIKTLRIVMLAPVAIVTGFLYNWRANALAASLPAASLTQEAVPPTAPAPAKISGTRVPSGTRPWFTAILRVWFLVPFVIMGLLVSFVPQTRDFLISLAPWTTFIFAAGLGSIGFTIEIESVINFGSKPLLISILGWLAVLVLFLIATPLLVF